MVCGMGHALSAKSVLSLLTSLYFTTHVISNSEFLQVFKRIKRKTSLLYNVEHKVFTRDTSRVRRSLDVTFYNVALRKAANQSSQYKQHSPQLANDGSRNQASGHCAMSNKESDPWWKVKLVDEDIDYFMILGAKIYSVKWNGSLANFKVRVSMDNRRWSGTCFKYSGRPTSVYDVRCRRYMFARSVGVTSHDLKKGFHMSLCEVEVMGTLATQDTQNSLDFESPLHEVTSNVALNWTDWSRCSTTCGPGTKRRSRTCENKPCFGSNIEQMDCENPVCDENEKGTWSEWYAWSGCSRECGDGHRERYRECFNKWGLQGHSCKGLETQKKSCYLKVCPLERLPFGRANIAINKTTRQSTRFHGKYGSELTVDGVLKQDVDHCSRTSPEHAPSWLVHLAHEPDNYEITGLKIYLGNESLPINSFKVLVHSDPEKIFDGDAPLCFKYRGVPSRAAILNVKCSRPLTGRIVGILSQKSLVKYKLVLCEVQVFGIYINKVNSKKLSEYYLRQRSGQNYGWSSWSECTSTCGAGVQTRTMNCAEFPCKGSNWQEKKCDNLVCEPAPPGAWTSWDNWSWCTKHCDQGIRKRARRCLDGKGYSTTTCAGKETEEKSCLISRCADVKYVLTMTGDVDARELTTPPALTGVSAPKECQTVPRKFQGYWNVSYTDFRFLELGNKNVTVKGAEIYGDPFVKLFKSIALNKIFCPDEYTVQMLADLKGTGKHAQCVTIKEHRGIMIGRVVTKGQRDLSQTPDCVGQTPDERLEFVMNRHRGNKTFEDVHILTTIPDRRRGLPCSSPPEKFLGEFVLDLQETDIVSFHKTKYVAEGDGTRAAGFAERVNYADVRCFPKYNGVRILTKVNQKKFQCLTLQQNMDDQTYQGNMIVAANVSSLYSMFLACRLRFRLPSSARANMYPVTMKRRHQSDFSESHASHLVAKREARFGEGIVVVPSFDGPYPNSEDYLPTQFFEEGTDNVLQCFEGLSNLNVLDMETTWFNKNKEPLDESSISLTREGDLYFSNVQLSVSGSYYCMMMAMDLEGVPINKVFTHTVEVYSKPEVGLDINFAYDTDTCHSAATVEKQQAIRKDVGDIISDEKCRVRKFETKCMERVGSTKNAEIRVHLTLLPSTQYKLPSCKHLCENKLVPRYLTQTYKRIKQHLLEEERFMGSVTYQMSSLHKNVHVICSPGWYPDNLRCLSCPAGTYSDIGWAKCELCRQGSYQHTRGQSDCIECPFNYTTSGEGSCSASECMDPSVVTLYQVFTGVFAAKENSPRSRKIYVVVGSSLLISSVVALTCYAVCRRYIPTSSGLRSADTKALIQLKEGDRQILQPLLSEMSCDNPRQEATEEKRKEAERVLSNEPRTEATLGTLEETPSAVAFVPSNNFLSEQVTA